MAKKRTTRKRTKNGRFAKGGGTTAIAIVGPRTPARRRRSVAVARRRSVAVARRRSSGGGAVGGALRYVGGPRVDDLLASAGLGLLVNKRRATVETIVNYAPEQARAIGAYGIIAVMAGIASHLGIARKYTSPIARASTTIAVNKLTTRGALYGPGDLNASLSGDDSAEGDDDDGYTGEDDLDVEGMDDDDGAEGDDGDGDADD